MKKSLKTVNKKYLWKITVKVKNLKADFKKMAPSYKNILCGNNINKPKLK